MPGFNINGSGNGPDGKMEVHRSYRWKLLYIKGGGSHISEKLRDIAVELTLPSMDFDILSIQGMSLEYKIPKKPVFSNIDITFYDIVGLTSYFDKWQRKIWDQSKGLFEGKTTNVGQDLRGELGFELIDHEGKTLESFTLFHAWPKKVSHSKLSMKDDSLKTVSVEFVYDYFEHKDK